MDGLFGDRYLHAAVALAAAVAGLVEPLRFTTEELDAAGIDPARFGLGA